MRQTIVTVGVLVALLVALAARQALVSPAERTQPAAGGPATTQADAPSSSPTAAVALTTAQAQAMCGVGLAGQSPMLGAFTAASASEIKARLPNLKLLGGIETFTPPFDVVLFSRGVYRWPVHIWGSGPGVKAYEDAPHTVLCLVHDGRADFYTDGDSSGYVAQP